MRTSYGGTTQTVLSQLTENPSGQLTKLRYGNALVETRSYDLAGQLTQLKRTGLPALAYSYDGSGNITQIGTERYSYDSLDRLLQAQGAAPRSYSYDANGNRTSSDASPYILAVDSNRLLQGSARVYDYDAAGNPLSDGRYNYTYDSQGRLTETKQGATTLVRSTYNALGQRVRKDAARSTHYLYGMDGQLLAELDANGNTVREYLYLQSWPIAVVDYAAPVAPAAAGDELTTDSVEEYPEAAESPSVASPASSEKPVATTRPPASVDGRAVTASLPPAGVLTHLHPDHLGTPRLATDSAKRVVWRWDSAPFGDTPPQEDPDGDGVPFTLNLRFPGQYFDAETGLHYNYYRDYDPATGRYLESDPIGLRGGVGTYGYVGGRPLNFTDFTGLEKDCDCGGKTKRCSCTAIEATKKPYHVDRWYGHDKFTVCDYKCRAGDDPEETVTGTSPVDRQILSYSSLWDTGFELGLYCIHPRLKEHYFPATGKFSAHADGYDAFNPAGSGSPELESWAKKKCCKK